jgi:pimeloyl-ACP methyl ester carboxylesterase
MGHSMGGKVAFKFAFEYPQMVEKLIVVDIGMKEYPVKDENLIGAMVNLELRKFASRKEIEIELGKDTKEESMRLFIMQNLIRTQDNGFSWKMNLDVLSQNTDQVSKAINVGGIFNPPTLFVSGGNSDYLLPEDRGGLQKHFANIQFEVIENAGHWVHADEPESFNNSIAEFLEIP